MIGISFRVPGEPVGKGRPRFVRATGRTYTPDKTARYENLVELEYQAAAQGEWLGDDTELAILVTAYYTIPASASKRRKHDMRLGLIRPTKKPDTDNVLKVIADALNGLAYRDDAQIVSAQVQKHYDDGQGPRVEVKIWKI